MGKIFLLSVGINNYPHLNQLNCCVADAQLIYDNYSQFDCQYKSILLNENASKEEILKSIYDIKNTIRDEDFFIFSFAGHGFEKSEGQEDINSKNSFICPHKFSPKYQDLTAISLYDLNEEINSLEADYKLVFFDACHSGGALRKITEEFGLRGIEITNLFEILGNNTGTCIFTACDSHEKAGENRKIGHGIFTYSLIESLKELGRDKEFAIFKEVHGLVSSKVKAATDGIQNPQVKCNKDDFRVFTLPESRHSARSEAKISTPIASPSISTISPDEMKQIEETVIQLISDDRFIELDKLFKSKINLIYKKLATPDIPYSAETKDAMPYYESCREYLKPLILISNYDIEYYNSRCLLNNLDEILRFEKLCREKSGNKAIIEIPLVLITEFLFQIMAKAYSRKDVEILRIITSYQLDFHGVIVPIVYHISFWTPYIFGGSSYHFLHYLSEKWKGNDIFSNKLIEDMNEICLLFNCYASNQERYVFDPTYFPFNDFNAPNRVTSKLESGELDDFIENLFSVKIEKFVPIMIKNLNSIATSYSGFKYLDMTKSLREAISRLGQLNHI